MKKQILDACCGSRMFHFDKSNPLVLFMDCRTEDTTLCDGRKLVVKPDVIGDFRKMPFERERFNMVIFDPPHLKVGGDNAWMVKKYGRLEKNTWKQDIKKGFSECWRVLSKGGTMIFKWNETQIKMKEITPLFPESPVVGHRTTNNLKTHWTTFYKQI